MSKKTKRLVLLGLFIVVLAAVLLIVSHIGRQREEKEAEEADIAENGFVIQQMDEDKIVGFSYQHHGDEDFGEEQYIFTKQGDTWFYKNDVNFPVNQDIARLRVEDLSTVYAKRLLEDSSENFAAYGLDEPKLVISVTDGKQTVTYNIGNYNESTADYYLNIDGTNQVYTVDATLWVGFSMGLYDMVEVEEFPEIQDDHISKLVIETPDDTLTFDFEITDTQTEASTGKVTNVGDWYVIDSEGNRVRANNTKVSALVSMIIDTEYVQEVNYHCPEDELDRYGLDAPSVVITVDYTVDQVNLGSVEQEQISDNISEIQYETKTVEKQLVLSIGSTTDTFSYTDDYYVKTNLNSSILTLDAESAEMYAVLTRDNFVSVQKITLPTEEVDD